MEEEVKTIGLQIHYVTNHRRGSNDFKNLQELKIWLDNHPKFSEALGYTKGEKSNSEK